MSLPMVRHDGIELAIPLDLSYHCSTELLWTNLYTNIHNDSVNETSYGVKITGLQVCTLVVVCKRDRCEWVGLGEGSPHVLLLCPHYVASVNPFRRVQPPLHRLFNEDSCPLRDLEGFNSIHTT